MRVRDLDPNREVYVAARRPKKVHLRKSCHHLKTEVYAKLAGVLDSSKHVCKDCEDPRSHSRRMENIEKNDFASILENADPDDFGELQL